MLPKELENLYFFQESICEALEIKKKSHILRSNNKVDGLQYEYLQMPNEL